MASMSLKAYNRFNNTSIGSHHVSWCVFGTAQLAGFQNPPPLSYFGSRPNFARAKYCSGSVPWSVFAPQPTETLAMQARSPE